MQNVKLVGFVYCQKLNQLQLCDRNELTACILTWKQYL